MLPGAQEAHERQLSGFLSVGLALGDTHCTSDFIHSCLQFHPQSSRPRHAGWTSLFLHHHLTPSSSDSFSPSLHGVSPLQLSDIKLPEPGQGRTLPLAKPGLPVLGSPASPFSSGTHPGSESSLFKMRMLPPSLSPHRHLGMLLTPVLAWHGASSQWWGCSGLCASVGL